MLDQKVRRKMPKPRESKVPSGRVAANFLNRNTFTKYTTSESDRYTSLGTTGDFIPPNQRMLAKLQKPETLRKGLEGLRKDK